MAEIKKLPFGNENIKEEIKINPEATGGPRIISSSSKGREQFHRLQQNKYKKEKKAWK